MVVVRELHDESASHNDWLSVQMKMKQTSDRLSLHLWRCIVKQLP